MHSQKEISFLADVMHEIEMLKLHTTQEEKESLFFGNLDPDSPSECIYGQMFDGCYTPRAKKMMDKCCIRVMDLANIPGRFTIAKGVEINDEAFNINGTNRGQGWKTSFLPRNGRLRNYNHLSALEGYIFTKGAKNKEIIQYIKGEIPTLDL